MKKSLLDLPVEVRLNIHENVFFDFAASDFAGGDKNITAKTQAEAIITRTALPLTCKRFYEECKGLFFSSAVLEVSAIVNPFADSEEYYVIHKRSNSLFRKENYFHSDAHVFRNLSIVQDPFRDLRKILNKTNMPPHYLNRMTRISLVRRRSSFIDRTLFEDAMKQLAASTCEIMERFPNLEHLYLICLSMPDLFADTIYGSRERTQVRRNCPIRNLFEAFSESSPNRIYRLDYGG